MPRHLNPLPGRQVLEDLFLRLGEVLLEFLDFLLRTDPERLGLLSQLFQFGLNFKNRLFKIEQIFHASFSLVFPEPGRNAQMEL